MIFNQKWYQCGIKYIKDLIIGNRWITHAELSDKIGIKINFLDLLSIEKAMPDGWKYHFTSNTVNILEYRADTTVFSCKSLYIDIIKNKVELPECYLRHWENTLNTEIDIEYWFESFTDCFKWTCSSKLRSFLFQIRNLDIMTNVKLFNMKKRSDPFCEWCTNGKQDMLHLFWECPVTNKIWVEINKWINRKLNCELEIKQELLFLYDIDAGNYTCIINLMVLIVMRYIYVSHCIKIKPIFIGAVLKIEEVERMERTISCKKGKLVNHLKKWSTIVEL